jgi:hypothetical protein
MTIEECMKKLGANDYECCLEDGTLAVSTGQLVEGLPSMVFITQKDLDEGTYPALADAIANLPDIAD